MQLPANYNKTINEKAIQDSIIDLLKYHGYYVWRQNTGVGKYRNSTGVERWIKYGHPGFSDIFAIQPGGRFCAIECKRDEKQKPTPQQLEFIKMVNDKGGIAFVAWSIEQVAEKLNIRMLI